LKVEIEWVDTTSVNRILPADQQGGHHIATFGPPRAGEAGSLTKPYVPGISYWAGRRTGRSSPTDLKGKTIAVTRGTTQDIAITKLAPKPKSCATRMTRCHARLRAEEGDVLPTAEVLALKKVKDNKEMDHGIVAVLPPWRSPRGS
jgi:hypothetical protein